MANKLEQYVCNYPSCRKTFTRKHDWSRHLDTHLGIAYHCDKCGKKFSRMNTLNNHSKQCGVKPQPYASMDGQLVDVTPVLPVSITQNPQPVSAASTIVSPQPGFWIQTQQSQSVNKAIKILLKYHHFDPVTPSPTDSQKRPRVAHTNPNAVPTNPAQKLMD